MKKFLFLLAVAYCQLSTAQVPFSTIDSIDINNIKAMALVHGDMWWRPGVSPVAGQYGCFFPKGDPKPISFAAAMWLSGYDDGGNLHVSAQTYRQDGNDYWPGPLDASGGLSYATSSDWARIWKVNRTEVTDHKNRTFRNISNTPASILEWPGKGNVYARGKDGVPLIIGREMAPFIDKNGDGIYQPLKGDYPDFKGDQALWWVFSDNGPSHNQTGGDPLKVEVAVMAYAYKRNTLIDNVVYYDYAITNRSTNNYHSVRWALWEDTYQRFLSDDFARFDSAKRLSIFFRNNASGGAGSPYLPDSNANGVTLVHAPNDLGFAYAPVGAFVYYNNDPSIIGNPVVPGDYNGYMNARLKNGSHFQYSGVDIDYVFGWNSPPISPTGLSECLVLGDGWDKRFVLSTGDFSLLPNETQHVVIALVADSLANGCPNVNYDGIKAVADTAWGVYHNPPPEVAVHDVAEITAGLRIFPNPAHDHITVNANGVQDGSLCVFDLLGVKVASSTIRNGEARLAIDALSAGMYVARITSKDIVTSAYFMKE
jgi:hypothetical protein